MMGGTITRNVSIATQSQRSRCAGSSHACARKRLQQNYVRQAEGCLQQLRSHPKAPARAALPQIVHQPPAHTSSSAEAGKQQ